MYSLKIAIVFAEEIVKVSDKPTTGRERFRLFRTAWQKVPKHISQ